MRESNATFNDDDRQLAIPLNKLFPAHITKSSVRENGNRFNYNPTFRIHDEASLIENIPAYVYAKNENGETVKTPVTEMVDGKERQKIVNGAFMTGREYQYHKVGSNFPGFSFLDEAMPKNERWKNQEYVDIIEALQMEFSKTKDGARLLFVMEDEDLLGLPCYVRLGRVTLPKRVRNEDGVWVETGDTIQITKAIEVCPWETGKRMPLTQIEELYRKDDEEDELDDSDDIKF